MLDGISHDALLVSTHDPYSFSNFVVVHVPRFDIGDTFVKNAWIPVLI